MRGEGCRGKAVQVSMTQLYRGASGFVWANRAADSVAATMHDMILGDLSED